MEVSTLERLLPDTIAADDHANQETYQLHLERYQFASRNLVAGNVLDLACGVGYGSRLLRDTADKQFTVTGGDIEAGAVAYAKQRYAVEGLEYVVADAMAWTPPTPVMNVISLETIEHLPDPVTYVKRVASFLPKGGMFIASVPTTPSVDVNPFHLHDFTESSFRRMVEPNGFEEVTSFRQIQIVPFTTLLFRKDNRLAKIRPNLLSWYIKHPRKILDRAFATLTKGLNAHYITIAWRKI